LNNRTLLRLQIKILHEKFHALHGFAIGESHGVFTAVTEITTDNFHLGRLLRDRVIDNGKPGAVDPHIRRRFVKRRFARNFFQNSFQDGKNFHVAVIIDGFFAVRVKMKRIDQIEIPDIGGGRLIGHIHRML